MSRLAIVLTHYDSAAYLPHAVRSILNQTFDDFHLYLLDDSTNNSKWYENLSHMLHSPKLSVYKSNKNVGTYRLKNRFIQSLDTEFIAFHDADDMSLPNRFERQILTMRTKSIGMLGCSFYQFDEASQFTRYIRMPSNVNSTFENGKRLVCLHPTWLLRRELLNTLGGFDFETRFGADDDFLARAIFCTKVRNLKEALYVKYEHCKSLTGSTSTGLKSKLRLDYICKTDRKIEHIEGLKKNKRNVFLKMKSDDSEFIFEKIK